MSDISTSTTIPNELSGSGGTNTVTTNPVPSTLPGLPQVSGWVMILGVPIVIILAGTRIGPVIVAALAAALLYQFVKPASKPS
jgi:hypothetical protein